MFLKTKTDIRTTRDHLFVSQQVDIKTHVIDVLVVVPDVVKLDLIVVSGSEGVRLVDFSCEEKKFNSRK